MMHIRKSNGQGGFIFTKVSINQCVGTKDFHMIHGQIHRTEGAYTVIEGQIKVNRKLRRRIEQIREMVSSTSIQKKT